jgi:integrase
VKRATTGALVHPTTPLDELAAKWIADITPELGRKMDKTLETYARHWSKHFKTIGNLSPATIGDYSRKRLSHVVRDTVVKELTAFRRFLLWCVEKEYLHTCPVVPMPGEKVTGTRHASGRRAPQIALTPEQAVAIIAELPEWSRRSRKDGRRHPIRAFFEWLYETGLRPEGTVELLEPRDVTPFGLNIRPELDKNRWSRVVPLSLAARAAYARLGELEPGEPIFGDHDRRDALRKAATAVLGEDAGKLVTPYDFKHTRVTAWFDEGRDVLGVEYLTGTKYALDRYAHASRRAAEKIVFGGLSGDDMSDDSAKGGNRTRMEVTPLAPQARGAAGNSGENSGSPGPNGARRSIKIKRSGDRPPIDLELPAGVRIALFKRGAA